MLCPLILASLSVAVAEMPPAPPASGTVAVALAGGPDRSAADQPFVDAVGQALGDANFTLLADHSRYVAEVSVERIGKGLCSAEAMLTNQLKQPIN